MNKQVNPEPPKQVIVVRKDLNMRKGKIAAQAAHASNKVLLDQMPIVDDGSGIITRTIKFARGSHMERWLNGNFKKICVGVDSEEDLTQIYDSAVSLGLPAALIVDSGLTEFNGVPTVTCCAIGPGNVDLVNLVTGSLKLL